MKNKALILYRRGFTYERIAKTLDISVRHAIRLVTEGRDEIDKIMHDIAKKGFEDAAWYALASEAGLTLNEIANRVGVSVQFVEERIRPFLR
ncbi:hypothetical protein Calab_1482 [Caldithrix abyssi DSM 13497]|uniref:Uncharacterized protein n=1 Tax=Caldithrix abyssi DSM 13497 TaxID=880073 RepID=H1XPX7_CALAY|nr:hypothetical protein [Caldithrix abyssi]APF20368.1 hypothetical protein Cabys_3622 [Caldithrix abyssi DSM 13497]EHO41103.1 hypothetical protein Calab_1482 [Caldithrix abyssi DSM 13497]